MMNTIAQIPVKPERPRPQKNPDRTVKPKYKGVTVSVNPVCQTMRWPLLSALAAVSCAKVIPEDAHQLGNNGSNRMLNCLEAPSFRSCLKMNTLLLLDDLTLDGSPIPILGDSLMLVKSEEPEGSRRLPVGVEELNASLPVDAGSREDALSKLVFYSVGRFIRSRALQVRLSDVLLGHWNIVEEGRKKKEGGMGMAFMMAGGMMAALGLSGIAMLAGKALMVSMMALMLSFLAAMGKGGGGKSGGGHGDHAATTYEVINVPTGHGYHGRSLKRSLAGPRGLQGLVGGPPDLPGVDAALLAYRAHLETVSNGANALK